MNNNEPKVSTPTELISPIAQAAVNQMVGAAVKEAVTAMFANFAPMVEKLALTPEKIAEAERLRRAPDPEAVARDKREKALMKEDLEESQRMQAERQRTCPHRDKNEKSSISLVHNFPDRQPRGVCMMCNLWIHPAEWRIGPPTEKEPRGHAYVVKEHPLYQIVRQLESLS